jgi:hypothetical protein
MKAIGFKIAIIVSFFLGFIACSNNGEVRQLTVSAVKTLYEPADGQAIVLQPSVSASLLFSWEPALAEDGGMVLYEIAFDKADGDFSNPVFIKASDKNGGQPYATVTHKQLNQIAAMMGIDSEKTGTFKWTVFSSKGINPVKADVTRNITVTRLPGFADIPDNVYITGDATEPGADLSKAYIMKKVADGEFEIYTQLTAGKSFKFVNANIGTPTEYSVSGDKIVLGGTTQATKTSIYKYYLDFNVGSFSTKEVTMVYWFLNWSQRKIELPYIGNGIWGITNYTITGLTGSDNTDDRYKFRMESSEGETEWRAPSNDSKPSGNASYYYMVEKTNVAQWTDGQIWKAPWTDGWSDKSYDVTFILNAQGSYTHNLVVK